MKSTVAKRIFFGLLMTGALAGLLVGEGYLSVHNYFFLSAGFRGIGFTLFVAIILIKAIQEMARLAWAKGMNPAVWLVVPVIMLLVTQPYWSPQDNETLIIFIILFATLFLSAITQGIKYGTQNTLTNLGVTCLMVIYLGIGGWFLVSLRLLGKDSETIWYQVGPLVMFLSCVKCSDIGAYFTGRFIGRHKLAPGISPGKTWEGFCGGIILAVIIASLFSNFSGIMNIGRSIVFGITIAIIGQLGDLLESMYKRDAGSKDSDNLVPEFGGMLDLVDSPLIAAPVAYLMFIS